MSKGDSFEELEAHCSQGDYEKYIALLPKVDSLNAQIANLTADNEALKAERDRLKVRNDILADDILQIRMLVEEQAKDEGLWFVSKYATEAYLQKALRELHQEIGDT